MPRIHPAISTQAEVAEDSKNWFSDHAPCLFELSLNSMANPVKLLTWNILHNRHPSGCHLEQFSWENEDKSAIRFARIVNILSRFSDKYNLDVIVLQEANSQLITPYLRRALPDWQIIDSECGLITLTHRKDKNGRVELVSHHFEIALKFSGVNMQSCLTTQIEIKDQSAELFIIHNVHSAFQQTPLYHEGLYRNLLNSGSAKSTVIVIGDTNARIAPLDRSIQNITTYAIPMTLNQENGVAHDVQIPDFPDGAFVKIAGGPIMQLERRTLDPNTAKCYKSLPAKEPQFCEFRMLLVLDPSKNSLIDGLTVAEYENKLQKLFEDPAILVRHAAKDNNERGFGLWLNHISSLRAYLARQLHDQLMQEPQNFQQLWRTDERTGTRFALWFVHEDKCPILLKALQPLVQALENVDTQIATQQSTLRNLFLSSPQSKIESLRVLRSNILSDIGEKSLERIIAAWNAETVTVNHQSLTRAELLAQPRNFFAFKWNTPTSATCVASIVQKPAAAPNVPASEPPSREEVPEARSSFIN